MALWSSEKTARDLGPGFLSMLSLGSRPRLDEAIDDVAGDGIGGLVATAREARPVIQIDEHGMAVGGDDEIAAEYLEPERGGAGARGVPQHGKRGRDLGILRVA